MANALENLGQEPTYLEFFGLTRPPFARLSDPSQIFHTEQYSLLMALLANATNISDCLVVMCGADGSGKTTLLNRYISSLGDDICYATIDDTCKSEKQFYCDFLRQLGFGDITGTSRELRRIAKEYIVQRGMAGDAVLMMIDNAHLISPIVLEQLRWLAATKVDNRRVLSVVLSGNSDLVRIMDSPAMSQVNFRSHIVFNIRVYTEDETANYVRHRLKLAGGVDSVKFSDDAHPLIYRYTGGNSSLINTLCNAVLTEAFGLKSRVVSEDLVRGVADRRRLLPHVVPLQRKGRRKSDPDFKLVPTDEESDERITARQATPEESSKALLMKNDLPEMDVENLMDQFSLLSEQFAELKANNKRASLDVATRNQDITELRELLDAKSREAEKLTGELGSSKDEIGRLTQTQIESIDALRKSEEAADRLAADLEKTQQIAIDAESAVAEVEAKVVKQRELKSELQSKVDDLAADLQLAEEQLDETNNQKKDSTALKSEVEKMSDEYLALKSKLDKREEDLAGLEETLQQTQEKREEELAGLDELLRQSQTEREKELAGLEELLQKSQEEREEERAGLEERLQQTKEERDKERAGLEERLQQTQEERDKERVGLEERLQQTQEERDKERAGLEERLHQSQEDREKKLAGLEELLQQSQEKREEERTGLEELLRQTQDKREKELTDLKESLQKSQEECDSLRPLEAAVKDLDESVAEKEARIENLKTELGSYSAEIVSLEEKIEGLQQSDVDSSNAESILALETELKEANRLLMESHEQLSDSLNKSSKSASDEQNPPKSDYHLSNRLLAPIQDSPIEPHGVVVTSLEAIRDGEVEFVMELPKGESRIMIGRSEDSDLRLKSEFVSRHHALIFCTGQGVYIEDLNSFNGTVVNSNMISRCDLKIGDIVTIGDYRLRPVTSET